MCAPFKVGSPNQIQLGLGGKKTEAMALVPPRSRAQHPLLPQLTVKGHIIQWVTEYRYLGYLFRSDLRDDGALASMAGKLAGQWQRYFNTTAVIYKHSPALALQIFKTTVSGATNYLLAFANPTQGAAKKLDTVSLRAARKALRFSDRLDDLACNTMVWSESRLPRGAAILARERTRFALKMRTSPFANTDIAPRIFRALSATADADTLPDAHNAKSITHRIIQLERSSAMDGTAPTVLLQHTEFRNCSKTAAIVSRRTSLNQWQTEARAALAKDPLPPAADVLRPPISERGVAAYFNDFYRAPLSDAGYNKYTTVIATRGPGCCGGLLSQVSCIRRNLNVKLRALAAIRRGRKGMFDAPLAAPGRTFSEAMDLATVEGLAAGDGVWESKRATSRRLGAERRSEAASCPPCSLCGVDVEDPYHVLVSCTDAGTIAAREAFTRSLPDRIAYILRLLLLPPHVVDRLSYVGRNAEITRRERILHHVVDLAKNTNWDSADGKFALFHLLAVSTWSRRSLDAAMPLSNLVAEIFESSDFESKNHHIRPMVNSWVNWGATGVLSIFTAWNSAVAPRVAAALATEKPLRAARRAAAIVSSVSSPAGRASEQPRLPRPLGSRMPPRFDGFVVDRFG